MADMKISELSSVASLNNGDLIEVSQVDELSPTGYSSMKASMTDVGNKVNNNIQYTQDLDTTSKTVIGAINEKATVYEIGDINSTTKTITFSTTVRFLLFSTGGSNARLSTHLCIGRASTSFTQPLLNGSVVTVSASDNKITITTSADNVRFHMLLLNGKPDDFVIT